MKIGCVFKVVVCLASIVSQGSAVVHGSNTPCFEVDGRVQCAAAEAFSNIKSIDYFAAHQHLPNFQDPGYFIKNGEHFEWSEDAPKETTKNRLTCEEAVYLTHKKTINCLSVELISKSEEPPLEEGDCISLRKEIVRSHARVALQGQLPKKNPYSSHLAWRCERESCWPIGDLGWVNDLDEEHRKSVLQDLPITTCLAVDSRITKHSKRFAQTLSATIFGTIPTKIHDICGSIFAHYFSR